MTDDVKHALKAVVYLVGYWGIFVVLPFIYSANLSEGNLSYNYGMAFVIFILFIAPFFFYIPYKLSRLSGSKRKKIYVIIGLIIPYVAIYAYAYYALTHMQIGLF
jgi:hypothetical protein